MWFLIIILIMLIFSILMNAENNKVKAEIYKPKPYKNKTYYQPLSVINTELFIGNIKDWLRQNETNNLKINHKIEADINRIAVYGNNNFKLGYIDDEVAKKLFNNIDYKIELADTPTIEDIKDEKGNLHYKTSIKYNILSTN